jgi:hypothetical protein
MRRKKIEKIPEGMSFYPPLPTKEEWEKLPDNMFLLPTIWTDNMKYLSLHAFIVLPHIAYVNFTKGIEPRPLSIEEIYEYSNKNESTIDSIRKGCQELIDKKFIYPEMVKF